MWNLYTGMYVDSCTRKSLEAEEERKERKEEEEGEREGEREKYGREKESIKAGKGVEILR